MLGGFSLCGARPGPSDALVKPQLGLITSTARILLTVTSSEQIWKLHLAQDALCLDFIEPG